MAYGLSNGRVTDDVTWPPKVLGGSTVGYPSDSLASCFDFSAVVCVVVFAAQESYEISGLYRKGVVWSVCFSVISFWKWGSVSLVIFVMCCYAECDVQGAIKKFSVWPSSVQNKIKIGFASYSSNAQNTTCTLWHLGCKYFVHFSVLTKCLSDSVENANTRTAHKFLTNFSNDTTWPSKNLFHNSLFMTKRSSTTLILSQNNKAFNETNEIGQNCYFIILCNSVFPCRMQTNRRPLECTKYFQKN